MKEIQRRINSKPQKNKQKTWIEYYLLFNLQEIKNFESAQATYIINLSNNKEIMNLFERKIADTEKRITKLKVYKKIFQESLYNAMKRSKNHKDLKKELVTLKRLFLDKDDIEAVDKPYEANYESERQFLENNIEENKTKLGNAQNLFDKDHKKLMKENKDLIYIVNVLEREKSDIQSKTVEQYMNNEKSANLAKTNFIKKPQIPKFGGTGTYENKIRLLKDALIEVENDIQYVKMAKKKREKEKKMEEDKLKRKRGNSGNKYNF